MASAWAQKRAHPTFFEFKHNFLENKLALAGGARWKIEAGFKELKQEIGSSKSQTRNPDAVINHLHFCTMAATLTWLYAERLTHTPQRCYAVHGRRHFAFSDVRKLITEVALDQNFDRVFPKPAKPTQNSFITALLRMVA